MSLSQQLIKDIIIYSHQFQFSQGAKKGGIKSVIKKNIDEKCLN